ncbi:replication factor C, subunit RFC4 [Penicillium ochrochloron]
MKLLTKEEEDAHYRSVVKGGTIGGLLGLAGGAAGVMLAARRYHTIRNLTIPMKAFLVTSSGTFVGIIAADHASRDFEKQQNATKMWYENREDRLHAEELRGLSFTDRAVAFARREKYKIVGATWIASMIGSFVLVGRNPYLSGQQKIVQARVYAQGLTLAVLCASAAFEISDQRKGRGLLDAAKKGKKQQLEDAAEPAPVHAGNKDQGDLWKDMVAAEEQRLKSKHQSLHVKHEAHHAAAEAKGEASQSTSKDSKAEEKSESESEPESKEDPKAEKGEDKKQA